MVFNVFMIVAVCAVLAGIFLIFSGRKREKGCTAQATGKVVDIHCSSYFEGDTYAPVIEFLADGKTIRGKAQTEKGASRERVPFQVGDTVTVRYNPERPSRFLIHGYDINMKIFLGIGSVLAALILFLAACFLYAPW